MVSDADPAQRRLGRRLPLQHRRRQRRRLQEAGRAVRQGGLEQRGARPRSAIPPSAPTTTPRIPPSRAPASAASTVPLEMGNTIIKGFVNSRRTHFIYQPAIGSFYEGGQYSFKELLSARDPGRAGSTTTPGSTFCGTSAGSRRPAGRTPATPAASGGWCPSPAPPARPAPTRSTAATARPAT